MLVWLYVEEGVRRNRVSVNKFCRDRQFTWYANSGRQAAPWVIRGETLRRCYYDACKVLQTAGEDNLQARPGRGTGIRPHSSLPAALQLCWQAELQRRMDT